MNLLAIAVGERHFSRFSRRVVGLRPRRSGPTQSRRGWGHLTVFRRGYFGFMVQVIGRRSGYPTPKMVVLAHPGRYRAQSDPRVVTPPYSLRVSSENFEILLPRRRPGTRINVTRSREKRCTPWDEHGVSQRRVIEKPGASAEGRIARLGSAWGLARVARALTSPSRSRDAAAPSDAPSPSWRQRLGAPPDVHDRREKNPSWAPPIRRTSLDSCGPTQAASRTYEASCRGEPPGGTRARPTSRADELSRSRRSDATGRREKEKATGPDAVAKPHTEDLEARTRFAWTHCWRSHHQDLELRDFGRRERSTPSRGMFGAIVS